MWKLKVENKVGAILSGSVRKSMIPGIGISIPLYFIFVAAFQQSSHSWFARSYMGMKAFGGFGVVLGVFGSFVFIFYRRLISFPRTVTFKRRSIAVDYLFTPSKEYLTKDIVGVGRSSNGGRFVPLTFETAQGDEFSIMMNLYQSREIESYVARLGLTIF